MTKRIYSRVLKQTTNVNNTESVVYAEVRDCVSDLLDQSGLRLFEKVTKIKKIQQPSKFNIELS